MPGTVTLDSWVCQINNMAPNVQKISSLLCHLTCSPTLFPPHPFKVWVHWGRGNLLGFWENSLQYNESLLQDGTSSNVVNRKWEEDSCGITWVEGLLRNQEKGEKEQYLWDGSPWDLLKTSQYFQTCLGLNFGLANGKSWKLFHYPKCHFKPDEYQWKSWIQNNAGTRAGSEVKKTQNFTPPWMSHNCSFFKRGEQGFLAYSQHPFLRP